jgi:type IV secretion system protein VirB10
VTEPAAAPLPPPKEDPETLVLRGRPRSAIRFRRGLIVGVCATAAAALVGLTWAALEPPSFRIADEALAPEPVGAGKPDGLAEAPASYADVPRLGPPLPGDLGRPILEQQEKLAVAVGGPGEGIGAQSETMKTQAEQRLAEQAEAARTSSVLVRLESAAPPAPKLDSVVPPAMPIADPPAEASTAAGAAGQRRKMDFLRARPGDRNPVPHVDAPSRWILSAGTVIAASLITGLNSDLPGMVVAQVTENVRDSATGRTVLIPQGARLIGEYGTAVAFGQRRVLLVWRRILFPDGSSVGLDDMPATDAAGYSGVEDKVDFHEWRLLKGIALSSLLGVGGELGIAGDDRELIQALRESVQQNGARAGEQIVSRNLDVQPTLEVRPGWPVRAIVNEDLVLAPWRT